MRAVLHLVTAGLCLAGVATNSSLAAAEVNEGRDVAVVGLEPAAEVADVAESEASDLRVADAAPANVRAIEFSLKDLDGRTRTLKEQRGKVVVLNFWATWCGPCRVEMPRLHEVYDRVKGDGSMLTVYAVNVDNEQSVSGVKPLAKNMNIRFPVLLDTKNDVVMKYNPEGIIPLTVLIDHTGHVKYVHKGYMPGDERLVEKEISDLLKAAQQARAKKPTAKKK